MDQRSLEHSDRTLVSAMLHFPGWFLRFVLSIGGWHFLHLQFVNSKDRHL